MIASQGLWLSTGGLITAGAAILVTLALALAASKLTALKVIGVGPNLAVVLDGTIVRGLLVPAILRLACEANWWAPPRYASFTTHSASPTEPVGRNDRTPA
jgi:uncharacterized membrane protein YdfJ with MMPL/SSD domain